MKGRAVSDLWHEASEDHDAISRTAALAEAEGHLEPLWGFFFQAASARELEHRLAVGETRLFHIAGKTGVDIGDIAGIIRRRYALLREALMEGQDPVAPMVSATPSSGGGPAKPDEHSEGPDFSGSYSEVPMGQLSSPDPMVTRPVFDRPQQPTEATAAKKKCSCGRKLKNGKCPGCKAGSARCDCAPAAATPDDDDPGQKTGSRRTATPGMPPSNLPAGVGGNVQSSPDGSGSYSGSQGPMAMPGPGLQTSQGGYDLTPAQPVTAGRRDPVADHIRLVAASVAASNPGLPDSECRRVARLVVGRYLRRADLDSSVLHDDPGGGGSAGGGGGGGHMGEYMMGRQLMKKLPSAGGGGAGAAGGAAELGEVAELAAL